ncbi:MAG: ComEC/Rec2 family competence protein [Muribaculaceae bacterium]|nr:ComEC/Rec2 family competence protein [Muribaculaceae bacterium]
MKPSTSLLIIPLIALAIGIMAGSMGAGLIAGGLTLSAAAGCYFFLSNMTLDPIKGFKLNKWHYAWVFILFAGVGICDYSLTKPEDFGEETNNICFVEGRIISRTTTISGDRFLVDVECGWDSVTNRMVRTPGLKILAVTQGTGPEIDDIVRIKSRLRSVTDNENYFESGYASRMQNEGILYKTYFEPENGLKIGHKASLGGVAQRLRESIEIVIENSGLSTPTSHFLITLLLGDREFLHDDVRELFSDGGVSHMLALSGMHVGIIAGIVLWLLIPVNIIGRFKLRLVLTLIIILIYSFLTGMAPSTLRAVLMLGAITAGVILERKNNALNALFFSALVILLITPAALFDIGFQLSFLCVLALIVFADKLNPVMRKTHPVLYWIFGLIAASLVATGATWVVTAYYFGKVPLSFLEANIILLPLLPIYLLLAIIYIFLSACGLDFSLLADLLDTSYEGVLHLLNLLSGNGSSAINFRPSGLSVALWLLFIGALAFLLSADNKKLWGWISAVCLCVFAGSLFIFGNGEVKEGLIVQRTSRDIQILARNEGRDQHLKLERHAISEFCHNGDWFLSIDASPDSMQPLPGRHYKALILGGNFKTDIKKLLESVSTEIIITHPTLKRQREEKMLKAIDSLSIPRHSIRELGPWRYIQK